MGLGLVAYFKWQTTADAPGSGLSYATMAIAMGET
jgi:hypothetical protein